MRIRWFVIAILLAGLLAGCWSRSRQEDAWYRLPPQDNIGWQDWSTLDEALLHEVIDDRQAEAQALLEEEALVELTEEQAAT